MTVYREVHILSRNSFDDEQITKTLKCVFVLLDSQVIPLYVAAWQPTQGDRPMYDGPDLPSADLPEDLTGPEPSSVPIDVSTLHRIYGYETVGYYVDGDTGKFFRRLYHK